MYPLEMQAYVKDIRHHLREINTLLDKLARAEDIVAGARDIPPRYPVFIPKEGFGIAPLKESPYRLYEQQRARLKHYFWENDWVWTFEEYAEKGPEVLRTALEVGDRVMRAYPMWSDAHLVMKVMRGYAKAPEPCGNRTPTGYMCVLPKGHSGLHEAHDPDGLIVGWDGEDLRERRPNVIISGSPGSGPLRGDPKVCPACGGEVCGPDCPSKG